MLQCPVIARWSMYTTDAVFKVLAKSPLCSGTNNPLLVSAVQCCSTPTAQIFISVLLVQNKMCSFLFYHYKNKMWRPTSSLATTATMAVRCLSGTDNMSMNGLSMNVHAGLLNQHNVARLEATLCPYNKMHDCLFSVSIHDDWRFCYWWSKSSQTDNKSMKCNKATVVLRCWIT